MLTSEQEKWINHLNDTDSIKIIPFDSTAQEKFEKVKSIIQSKLGNKIVVEHRGATSLGISGQDEIDIYIPVSPDVFNDYITPLTELFGEPRSNYPLERARFVTSEDGKHVDVFLINNQCSGWLDGLKFEDYLKSHHESLEEYRKLKESGEGLSTREYYRKKIEFINDILTKNKK